MADGKNCQNNKKLGMIVKVRLKSLSKTINRVFYKEKLSGQLIVENISLIEVWTSILKQNLTVKSFCKHLSKVMSKMTFKQVTWIKQMVVKETRKPTARL